MTSTARVYIGPEILTFFRVDIGTTERTDGDNVGLSDVAYGYIAEDEQDIYGSFGEEIVHHIFKMKNAPVNVPLPSLTAYFVQPYQCVLNRALVNS